MHSIIIIECISWLIKATDNNDARWKPEAKIFNRFLIKNLNCPYITSLFIKHQLHLVGITYVTFYISDYLQHVSANVEPSSGRLNTREHVLLFFFSLRKN